MSKKSLHVKTVQKFIVDNRDNGKSDQDIYNELTQQYYDKKSIAFLITGTVTAENKKKYMIHNNTLLGLLGLYMLFEILFIFRLTIQAGQPWALLMLGSLLIVGYFMYEISRYYRLFYKFCGVMVIAEFLRKISEGVDQINFLINLFFVVSIAGFSFYLGEKMFPDYNPEDLIKNKKENMC